MTTLEELQRAYDEAALALREAQDRLGLAREHAREAHRELSEIEVQAIQGDVDDEALAAAKSKRGEAMRALREVRDELRS